MFIRERTRFRIPPLNAKKSPAVAELFAEREGFEPPVPLGTVVFKTTVIDHSTISPSDCLESGCKGNKFSAINQILNELFARY